MTAMLAIAGLLALFGFLAREVALGKPTALDRRVTLALRSSADPPRPIGPAWVQEAARDVTSPGSIIVVVMTTAAVAGYLFLTRKPGVAWLTACGRRWDHAEQLAQGHIEPSGVLTTAAAASRMNFARGTAVNS